MLDLKLMRQNPDAVVEGVRRRGDSLDMTPFWTQTVATVN